MPWAVSRICGRRRIFSGSPSAFRAPLASLFVYKGSVAVDGISLTVAGLWPPIVSQRKSCPYTMAHTNIGAMRVRDAVNLECDMVGKYVAAPAELAGIDGAAGGSGSI